MLITFEDKHNCFPNYVDRGTFFLVKKAMRVCRVKVVVDRAWSPVWFGLGNKSTVVEVGVKIVVMVTCQ